MGFVLNFLACLVTIFIGIYTYIRWKYQYWKKQGIPYIEPSFPFGSLGNPLTRTISFPELLQSHYKHLKSQGHKYAGLYTIGRAAFLPIHPDIVKSIMSKDFHNFVSRGVYYNEKADPISAHLFNIEGKQWRRLRVKLTPTFTSGKMKMMFPILVGCGDQLVTAVNKLSAKNESIDIKEILGCFTTDVIGSCAFGIECNSLDETESEFRKYGRKFFLPYSTLQYLKAVVSFAVPTIARFLGLSLIRKEISDFFFGAVKETVRYREETNFKRNDFMQILINMKNNVVDAEDHDTKGVEGHNLTVEEIAAQAFVFFVAGFETSSTTMTFCLLELALNPDIQEKVRDEVIEVLEKNGGELTYDSTMEMSYLGQVIDESLRKYPPVPVIPRMCVEDYKIPGTNAIIEKGIRAYIPAYSLHRDPEFFPDPEKFDPERFNEINKPNIPAFCYVPFGEGPRNCIGSRFGIMQTKVGLSVLLKNFRFTLNKKTTMPIKFNQFTFILLASDGVWLNVEKIN